MNDTTPENSSRQQIQIVGIGGNFTITLIDRISNQSRGQPDLHVQCQAATELFSAGPTNAWLEWPDVVAFVQELEELNSILKGKAEICAMSPLDLVLTLANLDSRGHVGVSFTIGRRNLTDNGQFESKVTGGFEALPPEIEMLLAWFKGIIAGGVKL